MLPQGLFGPLASPNRMHYWRLLCRLFDECFGPDAPMPPSIGFQRREITAAFERYLLTDDPWEEDGEAPDTPLAVRANLVYERFRRRIIEWARNPVAARMLDSIYEKTNVVIPRIVILPGRAKEGLSEHRAVVAAMRAGDGETAERLKRMNLQNAKETLRRFQKYVL